MKRKLLAGFLLLPMVLNLSAHPLRAEVTVEEVKEAVMKELAENAPKASADSPIFNPAMGVVIDAVAKESSRTNGDFDFRGAEVNFQSTVDPYAKAYAVINASSDEVEVEEAAVVTTSLPASMTLRFGRYFANFGRLPKFHDHELPFVERTTSLQTFFDGETKADGAELSHLFGLPFYLQGTLGVQNKIGADNTRLEERGPSTGDTEGRKWESFTYNARLVTYIPLGDNHGVDVGVSEAYTPRQNYIDGIFNDDSNNRRWLTGADVTYRYEPLANNVFRKVIWGSEVFQNDERRRQALALDTDSDGTGDTDTFERRKAWGGYSFVEARLLRQFSGGGFYDYAENLDDNKLVTRTTGVFVNFFASEFQRIRLQASDKKDNDPDSKTDHQLFLQWTATMGHHVHAFKDR